ATTVPAPETTASIGLQYDFRPTPMGTLSLRFDATHTGKMRFHPFQNLYDSAKARWLLDARASLNGIDLGGGDLRISLWIKNLADEEYREWGIDFASLGYAGATWGQPRTYGIDLVYQIGN
ncbi:MAG: TonB-dependent receptor, partial [Gammaproteobacteria bacterium]|nr:TonB-dependent receptor [Gammaproteobacteria bacterium]